ncbi:MAG TPA: EAL domain-containing protein [Spirochaetota bacterium]|jgi:EAL domain-containing protein (putative c-di-GMP-specific phosphodiesterase class I)|nr:EAL domain-containing protein [Spirochaetota bacterium]
MNMDADDKLIQLKGIIANEKVVTHFQPIVSVKKKQIVGFEALNRGVRECGLIAPDILMVYAKGLGLSLELDRLFRKKALESFKSIYAIDGEKFLSINVESDAIIKGFGSKKFLNSVIQNGISPSAIVIEILESDISDMDIIFKFVEEYRNLGFLIALDDFGAGFSNWSRIVSLRPNIVKLDKSLTEGVCNDFYKREVAASVTHLAHKTGALVIAEGVETLEDALVVMDFGADMLQGYFFSKPLDDLDLLDEVSREITELSAKLIKSKSRMILEAERELKFYFDRAHEIAGALSEIDETFINSILHDKIDKDEVIECAYVLNNDGIQISDTVVNTKIIGKFQSVMFHPDKIGADQSGKEYFYLISAGTDVAVTEPYLSSATGNICVTVSVTYHNKSGIKRILCVDMKK